MRAAIYERISMDRSGEAAGVTRQDEDCRALVTDLGWEIAEVYIDNDTSATNGKPRPAYRRMLDDIAAGRVDAIVVWHTDRLYRRLTDLEELAELCSRHRLAVRTCRSGEIDMSTPTGRMIAEILGSVAAYEVRQKADRWLRSVRQRREAGQWLNPANRPFGYDRDGAIRPDEARALQAAADHLLGGGTVPGACRLLNSEGFTTTRGNPWMPSSLRVTLRSPRIAAVSALNNTLVGDGTWKPILDRPTWERVRAILDTKRPEAPKPRRALLSGLVFCGVEDCGRRLYRGKNGYHIYRCETELNANGHVAISAKPLEAMVEAYARAKLANDEFRAAVASRMSSAGTATKRIIAEIDELEQQIRELDQALRTRQPGSRSKLALARSIDELDATVQARREALGRLTPMALPAADEWPETLDERIALIRTAVARVRVFPAKKRSGRFDHGRVRIDPIEQPPA